MTAVLISASGSIKNLWTASIKNNTPGDAAALRFIMSEWDYIPEKYKSVDQIPDGAKIAIMNDAMNMDRALKILQIAGLIKLSDKVKDSYSIIDIKENRKKLKIIDMEQAQRSAVFQKWMLLLYSSLI